MLLTDEEIQERVTSPLNLMNRLRRAAETKSTSPCLPSAADLIDNLDEKLEQTDIKKQAGKIMTAALKELEIRIPDMQKPEKLAQVAEQMNRILTADKGREEGNRAPQVIVYAPQVIAESHFPSIIINEDTK